MATRKFDPSVRRMFAERLKWLVEKREGSDSVQIALKIKATGGSLGARHLRRLLDGESSPTLDALAAILKACDISFGEFFEPWMPETPKGVNRRILLSLQDALKNPNSIQAHHVRHCYNIINPSNQIPDQIPEKL